VNACSHKALNFWILVLTDQRLVPIPRAMIPPVLSIKIQLHIVYQTRNGTYLVPTIRSKNRWTGILPPADRLLWEMVPLGILVHFSPLTARLDLEMNRLAD